MTTGSPPPDAARHGGLWAASSTSLSDRLAEHLGEPASFDREVLQPPGGAGDIEDVLRARAAGQDEAEHPPAVLRYLDGASLDERIRPPARLVLGDPHDKAGAAGGHKIDHLARGNKAAAVHDGDGHAEILDEIELMAREEHGFARPRRLGKDGAHRVHAGRVDARERLVEDDELRIVHQRRRQLHALLVAERQGLDTVTPPAGEAEARQPISGRAAGGGPAHPVQLSQVGELVGHAHRRVEPPLLRQVPEAAAACGVHGAPVPPHLAGVKGRDAEDGAHRRRLAGPVRPEKPEDLAGRDREAEVVEGNGGPETAGEVRKIEHGPTLRLLAARTTGFAVLASRVCPASGVCRNANLRRPAPAAYRGPVMEFSISDEHKLLQEAVGSIASKYGHDYFVAKAHAGEKADELWDEMARGGFLGVNVPEEFGGGGMGITELALVAEELAAQGCPLLLIVVSPAICATLINRFGTQGQRERWLPGFANGERKMAFAITEPDAGSNSHNISTVAVRDGDVYRLRGTKYYISGADEAGEVLVVTRTGADEASGKGKLSLFVVDLDSPGIDRSVIPVEITAPEKQFTLFFDDVEVPADRLIGTEGDGLRQVFMGLNPERILSAAMAAGIGRYALRKASEYGRDRRVWGMPVGAHQGISHPLAICKVNLELARLMNLKASWLYDNDQDAGEAANMAKYAAAEAAIAALDQAIQTHGGNGMSTEYGLADMWGMARLLRIAPVSREMILNFVAQHSLELPKSY